MLPARLLLLIILTFVAETKVFPQKVFTENSELKGWTSETIVKYSDFRGKAGQNMIRLRKEAGLQASATVGIKFALDVPKRRRDRETLAEKMIIAPFFFKLASVAFTKDEAELDKQRMYFDMAELHARLVRQHVVHLQDSLNKYGVVSEMFTSIKENYCNQFTKMCDDYTVEVLVDKIDGSYERWRTEITKQLKETEKYQTTKSDCHRLLTETCAEGYEPSKQSGFINCH